MQHFLKKDEGTRATNSIYFCVHFTHMKFSNNIKNKIVTNNN